MSFTPACPHARAVSALRAVLVVNEATTKKLSSGSALLERLPIFFRFLHHVGPVGGVHGSGVPCWALCSRPISRPSDKS